MQDNQQPTPADAPDTRGEATPLKQGDCGDPCREPHHLAFVIRKGAATFKQCAESIATIGKLYGYTAETSAITNSMPIVESFYEQLAQWIESGELAFVTRETSAA